MYIRIPKGRNPEPFPVKLSQLASLALDLQALALQPNVEANLL